VTPHHKLHGFIEFPLEKNRLSVRRKSTPHTIATIWEEMSPRYNRLTPHTNAKIWESMASSND
jgi:hypothetical protein